MALLIRSIIAIVIGIFLQHGFSAIAGRKSVIDSIVEAIEEIPTRQRDIGVTGKIAPPANRVPPKTEAPKDQGHSDDLQP